MLMRLYAPLAVLLSALAACSSSSETSPTEVKPDFTVHCVPIRVAVSNPAAQTKPRNTTGSSKFSVTNNCDVSAGGFIMSASRTGAVVSAGPPSVTELPILAPGASTTVLVPFTTGSSAGTGTVVLTATNDPGTVSTSGGFTVTVTP
jgi:hypothetical protein